MARSLSLVTTGLLVGALTALLAIGNGSLLFAGELRTFIPLSIGMSLFATMVMSVVASLTSSIRGVVVTVQEVPTVAMAAIAVAVGRAVHDQSDPQAVLGSIVVAIALATILCGVFSLLLGHFRLGALVRFIPYPVMGGFLAGSGWLIVEGGFAILHTPDPSLGAYLSPTPGLAFKLALCALFVVACVFVQRHARSLGVIVVVPLATIVIFNAVGLVANLDVQDLRATGWLLEMRTSQAIWPPVGMEEFGRVDWRAVVAGLLNLPVVIVLTVISVLLNATGIGLQQRRDIDLNRELVAVGWMNTAAGAGGGLPGFQAVSLTLLANSLGETTRAIGFMVAAVCLLAMVFGNVLMNGIPTVVFAGLLVWIGGQLLVEWLVNARRRLDRWEYLVILLIFLVIVVVGIPAGIAAGLLAAVVVFVVQYGRVDIVRHELTGAQHHSSANALDSRVAQLQKYGEAILIIRLQGYLFFGTADRLRQRIRQRLSSESDVPIRFLVIDFSRVTGFDSSTVVSFVQLQQLAEERGVHVVLTGLEADERRAFVRAGMSEEQPFLRYETDSQAGIKWAEDGLLRELAPEAYDVARPIRELLAEIVGDGTVAGRVAAICDRVEVAEGEVIIRQDDGSDDIFFIESGQAAVTTPTGGKGEMRLATVGAGAVVGELAYYLGDRRNASITAEAPMVVWRLSREALQELERGDPEAALALHRGLAAMLSRRLTQTNQLVRFLAD